MSIPVPSLEEILDDAIASHEKCVRYAAIQLSNYRRMKAALEHLEKGELDEVKQLLTLALNDNGDFEVKRIERITDKWLAEYAKHDT